MDKLTTVLIADSSEEFCSSLSAALHGSGGFQVLGTAADGEQAVRMVTEQNPDVLVLDLMLSKKDGISVLKSLSSLERPGGAAGGDPRWGEPAEKSFPP